MSKNSCFEHGEVHKVLLLIVLSSIERKGEREVHKRVNESLRVRVSVRALLGREPFCEHRTEAGRTDEGKKGTKRTIIRHSPGLPPWKENQHQTPLLSEGLGMVEGIPDVCIGVLLHAQQEVRE